jgi:hypothetical protein
MLVNLPRIFILAIWNDRVVFICLSSRVSTAGNFDEQFSRVDACDVVRAAYLSEYIRLPPTVVECEQAKTISDV